MHQHSRSVRGLPPHWQAYSINEVERNSEVEPSLKYIMDMTPEQMNQYCREEKYLDEYILVLYAKEGCPDCIDKLWNQYVNMVRDYVRKRFKKTMYFEIEELTNQCYFYFLDAIRKFEIDTGNKFGTFLRVNLQQISRYVIQLDSTVTRPADYHQQLKKDESVKVSSMSMDTLRKEDGTTFAETYEDEELLPDVTQGLDNAEARDYIESLLSTLSPLRSQIVTMRHLEGKTLVQVGKEIGMTEFKLKKQYQAAIQQLQHIANRNTVASHLTSLERD